MDSCCEKKHLVYGSPRPDDEKQIVTVVCGHCGHEYGDMPVADVESLYQHDRDENKEVR